MNKSMLRLSKLREAQKRQSEVAVRRTELDMQATLASQASLRPADHNLGREQSVRELRHNDMLLGHLQRTAVHLQGALQTARADLVDKSRAAKQIEKIVAQQRQAVAAKRERAEKQVVEAWLRSRRPAEEDR